MGLVRKVRNEYANARKVAEQAISSIRTMYAFSGKRKTHADFSDMLQAMVTLGLTQGLAKGLVMRKWHRVWFMGFHGMLR